MHGALGRLPFGDGRIVARRAGCGVGGQPGNAVDQIYQVWLMVNGNQRDNAGTFTVDQKGHATARIWASQPWNTYQEIGITLEPAKGSQWPTTPRLIGGPLH